MKSGNLFSLILLILLIAGCTSVPRQNGQIPTWFSNPPTDNENSIYFTISATGISSENAEENTGEVLFREILKYIGIDDEKSFNTELDEFKNSITLLIGGADNISGIKLIDKYMDEQKSESVMYILIEISRDQIDQTEKELLDFLQAGTTSSIYTSAAEDFIENGDFYNAALNYIKAALESAESNNISRVSWNAAEPGRVTEPNVRENAPVGAVPSAHMPFRFPIMRCIASA